MQIDINFKINILTMKWGINFAIIVFLICSLTCLLLITGCRETPIGYSIYNKVVMEEPSKLTYAYDAITYKYTYLNASEIKIVLEGLEILQETRCDGVWKMKGLTFVRDNVLERIVKIQFLNNSNHVYVSYEGDDIGKLLISEGYVKVKEGNYSKYNEYILAQNIAKSSRNGIWGCK